MVNHWSTNINHQTSQYFSMFIMFSSLFIPWLFNTHRPNRGPTGAPRALHRPVRPCHHSSPAGRSPAKSPHWGFHDCHPLPRYKECNRMTDVKGRKRCKRNQYPLILTQFCFDSAQQAFFEVCSTSRPFNTLSDQLHSHI